MIKNTLLAIKDTAAQLAAELILPAICALIATIYEYASSTQGLQGTLTSKSGFDILAAYFLKLFYWGAFFAYVLRAMKTVRDRKNHATVVQKQEAVLARMESLTRDLVGHSTGGDGHCYIWNVRHDGSNITSLEIAVVGDFAIQNVAIGLSSIASTKEGFQKMKATGNLQHFFRSDFSWKLDFLRPSMIHSVPCKIPLLGEVSRYFVRWQARNGNWSQKLEVDARNLVPRPVRTVVITDDNNKISDPKGIDFETPEWQFHA